MHQSNTPPAAPAEPKHSHYVSLDNHCIHQAMSSPVGYEDEHMSEWRPATPAEIQRYQSGDYRPAHSYEPMPLSAIPALVASPSSLTLEADDIDTVPAPPLPPPPSDWQAHVAPTANGVVPVAPQPAPVAPLAPATVAPAIDIPPAPATTE